MVSCSVLDGTRPAKIVANRVNPIDGTHRMMIEDEKGNRSEFNAKYVGNIRKLYPNAEMELGKNDYLVFKQAAEERAAKEKRMDYTVSTKDKKGR